ncbi:MAG: chorismate-binding protein [Pseudomonadota bacterium]
MSADFSATCCEIDFPLPGDGARLRFAAAAPAEVLVADEPAAVPALLARAEAFARAGGWAVGYVGYEAAAAFGPALRTRPADAHAPPCALFALYHQPDAASPPPGAALAGHWHDETPRPRFDAALDAIRAGIAAGDYYQVNYTSRLHAPLLGDARAYFARLRAAQPEAHCAYLEFGRWRICSVSPELFFHWEMERDGTRALSTRPMKGTAARHADPRRDRESAALLRQSPKEQAENLMIVDLLRNDLGRIACLGSVRVPRLFAVEAWPTVWQMTSTVSCRTPATTTLGEVFAALFPCGSVTGAPKVAAMAAIAALETSPRGVYCGAIGVLRPGGEALFSVAIRTVTVDAAKAAMTCGIGSGITLDSTAAGEHAEWQDKRGFLRQAGDDYRLLETLRLHNGRYWLRRGHLRRIAASAAALGFRCERGELEAALAAVAARHPAGQWRVRLLLAPDGVAVAEAFPFEPDTGAAGVALAAQPVASDDPWLRHKTTRRATYDALQRAGAFDTLLWNERGELTEFTRGNLVVELDGRRLTPPLACGLLPGVLRAALLASRRVEEGIVTRDDLPRASALWFINSLRGMLPARLE